MKKFLVSVLAIAGLVACHNEEAVRMPEHNQAIAFADAFVENATRVADPSITKTTLGAFDVWAWMDAKDGTMLTEERVTENGDSWTYTNVQYWTPDHLFHFVAVAPVEPNNWTYNYADDTIEFTNVDGTEDLLLDYVTVNTENADYNTTYGDVNLQFAHLLSKVKCTFVNGYRTENVNVIVENVKITTANEAVYTIKNVAEGEWSVATGEVTLDLGNVVRTEATKSNATQNARFTIPNTDATYVVEFDVTVLNGEQKAIDALHKTSTITNVVLEQGKSYNFVAEISPETLNLQAIEFNVVGVDEWVEVEVAEANNASDIQHIIDETAPESEAHIVLTGDINLNDLLTRAAGATINIPAGKVVTIDLNGFTLTATDTTTKNYSAIDNRGTLVVKNGTIEVVATENSGWNRYSAVLANNPGGNLTVEDVTLVHNGGTDMAYGIDNLTNGKGTYAVTTIKNSTVKSTYRAVRQFLNGTEATNEMYVEAGAVLEGANKSIFFHDPSKSANTGKLVVAEGAQLKGDVYLFVTAGSTEWPVEVSIASSALVGGSKVTSGNVPAGYDVVEKNGNWVVECGVEENGNEISVSNASGLKWVANQVNSGADYFEGKTIVLTADIDLNGEEWTPIGSANKDHGFMGNFDGNGFAIKNLAIENIALDADGYAYAGLFGVTEGVDKDNQNYIKNLVIENVNINTNGHIVAAAIAYPYYTVLENIKVQGNVNIKGGDYTAGVLAYTRRCVDATNIAIEANGGSIEGNMTIGGVISDIQMNGGLTANYSNFKATGVTVKGVMHVGGISGIISRQTLDGAIVENVTIVCNDNRKGIVAGSLGDASTIKNVSYKNVTGATRVIGATYDTGRYVGQIVDVNGVKAVVYSIADGVKAVSAEELNLKSKNANDAAAWAEGLGEGWSLASIYDLDAIHAARFDLNDALAADSADNALFCETEYYVDGKYAIYVSSTEAVGSDPQGEEYFANRVHLKYFNLNGYWDYNYSTFATINVNAPLKDNHFARGVYEL